MSPATTAPTMATPALHNAYLRVLERVLARRGCVSGLNSHRWGEYVDSDSLVAVLSEVSTTPAWPGLGLEIGADTDLLLHGRLGYAMAVSACLADALELMCRYSPLRAPAIRMAIDSNSREQTCVRINAEGLPPIARQLVGEALLVIVEQALRSLSSQTFFEARYQVPWPRPEWAAAYREHLDGKVEFSAAGLTFAFPTSLLQSPCLGSDPQACASACAECERLLSQRRNDVSERVKLSLLSWRGPWPDAATMASRLAMSRRQLFRELSSEGCTYRGLVDTLRCEQACAALSHSDASMEVIAEQLGYADGSNFSRCFRRWTGLTPRQWRLRDRSASH